MGLRKRFRDFRDWCPQPPDRLPTKLNRHSMPIAAIVTVSIILSVSFFAFSGLMSNMSVPVIPLVNVGSSTNPTLLWNYTTGDSVYSSPAILNGVLYVGSLDGNIYALNATNGAKIWNYTTSGQVFPSPAVADGVVYDGSAVLPPPSGFPPWEQSASITTGAVYALNATNGVQLWKYVTGGYGVSSCPTVVGGVVYVGSWDGNIYALNATSGVKLWNYTTGGAVFSSAVAGGVIYVDSSDDNVYALNATNGDRLWNCITSSALLISYGGVLYPIWSSPVVVGGVVYVGSDNGTVYALNAKSGTVLWNYATTYIEPNYQVTILSSPVVVGGVVYIDSNNYYFYALNATDGDQLWNCTTSGEFDTSPAVVGDVIYVGSYGPIANGNFCALNATDGDQLWNFTTSYYQTTSPAFFNGVVYAGGDNNVYALRVSPATSPSSKPFNTLAIIIGVVVAVLIVAVALLLIFQKRLKTKTTSPPTTTQNSTTASTIQIMRRNEAWKPSLQK